VKTLLFDNVLADHRAIDEIVQVLRAGGVVCFPVNGTYRLAADFHSEQAVSRLIQSKRRTANHPSLVLVPSLEIAKTIVRGTQWSTTKRLAEKFWPAALTLVLEPSAELPAKTKRTLAKATGKLGVRVPGDPLAHAVTKAFAGPLLLSSANLENKAGATSAAAITQRFVGKIDTKAGSPSTLVEVSEQSWKILREGAVSANDIERALKS
jgi:L-threonylcarbamoyladenylate synthase